VPRWLIPLLCATLMSPTLRAQGIPGAAVEGRVRDTGGVAIADAEVTILNRSNGERWRASTSSAGRFVLEHLSIGGPYQVDIRAIGFEPARLDGVLLSLGQRQRLDVKLKPGVTTLAPIEVRAADDPLINPGRTGPAQVIAESTLARLPLPGRNVLEAARVSPLFTGPGSVAGQNDRLNSVQVDGTSGGDLMGGVRTPGQALALRTLSVEAVKEVQVLAAPFDVRYGTFAAGLLEVATKSGSNRLEGSVSGYYTGRSLQGQDDTGSRGEQFDAYEISTALGGPLVRDRAAFFIQGGLQRGEFPVETPIIGGDTTGGTDSKDVGFRRTTVTRLQDIMRRVYGVEAGGTEPYPLTVPAGNLFSKVTLQLGVNSRLDLSYEYSRSTPDLLFSGCRVARVVFCLGSTAFQLPTQAHISRATWVAALGPKLSNDLLLAGSWFQQTCRTTDFPLVFVHADAGDIGVGGNSLCVGDRNEQDILELTDNLSLAAGTHHLTAGIHGELIRLPTHSNLVYGFAPTWHFANLDSLAAGLPDRYGGVLEHPARQGGPLSALSTQLLSPYLQDQWNVTPRLLLTAGVRADVPFISRHPVQNRALLEAFGVDNTRTPSGQLLWSPRLGVNYDLHGDGSTFLRGGVGLFAGRPAYGWFNEVYLHTGLDALRVDCDSTNVPRFTTDVERQPVACAESGRVSPVAGPVSTFDPEFRYPRSLKMALGADHRLPWSLVGTIDLLYSQGVNQFDLRELNLAPPVSVAAGEADWPLYGAIAADGFLRPSRLSPAFDRVVQVRNAHGDRSFSFTAQLQRHFGGGRELSASYTYTAARDLLSAGEDGAGNLDGVTLDGTLEQRRLAPSAWNAPHRLTLLAVADLPLRLRLTIFYQGSSGAHYDYRVDGDANGDGYGNDAVYVPAEASPGGDIRLVVEGPDGQLVPAPATEYAELDHFIERESCLRRQRGQVLRRNSCRHPWTSDMDARFSHVVPVPGGRSLELGLDIFNIPHLIDENWGVARRVDDTPLLLLTGYDAAAGRGVYRFLPRTPATADPGASRWRMQLGARLAL
jgi:hypothetical protein